MPTAIEMILEEHREAEALFARYEEAADSDEKRVVALELCAALSLHADMEEAILYPKLQERFGPEGDAMVDEAHTEHAAMKALVAAIEAMESDDPDIDEKVNALRESVTHHVEEEESELLPKAEKELPQAELEEMAEKIRQFRSDV